MSSPSFCCSNSTLSHIMAVAVKVLMPEKLFRPVEYELAFISFVHQDLHELMAAGCITSPSWTALAWVVCPPSPTMSRFWS
jgi:hypothetical protein